MRAWIVGIGVAVPGLLGPIRPAWAQSKPPEIVSPFMGSFSQAIPIQVPAFRGLEPKLVLGYSSEARSGFVGMGWSLSGWSSIERAKPGRGTPRYNTNDIYMLDGAELITCPGGTTSPGCTSGGSHATKNESFLKIKYDTPSNSWTVWGRDGTRTVFTPVYLVGANTFRWGQTSVIDTHGNTVTYAWACDQGDCYPDTITYGPYSVRFFRQARPDRMSFATGSATTLGTTLFSLRSIKITGSGTNIRAYKLTHVQSTVNKRSLLTEVQQFGRDAVIDGAGLITGGTSLPAMKFTYKGNANDKTFQLWAGY